jgi:hypothetical protein
MGMGLVRIIRCTVAVAVAAAAVLPVSGPAAAGVVAPPDGTITLKVYAINGSGCNADTATVEGSPDNTSFHVTYTNFVAWVGPGAKPTDFRKNCQLNVLIRVPAGFTYAIAKTEYNGYARLANGASGMLRATYYSAGTAQRATFTRSFKGPYRDGWQATEIVEPEWLIYVPCGEARTVNLNTELRVSAGTSDPRVDASSMAMHTADGSVRTEYHYAWRRCP